MATSNPSSSSWTDGSFGTRSAYPLPARGLRRQWPMIDALKRWAKAMDRWLQAHRSTRVLRQAAIGFVQHEVLQHAGSMAYFSILSIFQLLVLGVVVLSYFLGEGEARQFVIEQIRAGSPLNTEAIAGVIDA